jgi:hypothetical protein
MKKIRHIKDIQHEKLRLRVKQLELEKQMRQNWRELKEDLSPRNFIEHRIEDFTHKKSSQGHLLSDAVSYGVSYLTRKLSEKAGQKAEAAMQQGIDKLAEKVKTVFKKK